MQEDIEEQKQGTSNSETDAAEENLQHSPEAPDASKTTMEAPPLSPLGQESSQPFYARNPLTVGFCLLLVIVYGLTTFSTEFKGPSDLIVTLGGFYPPLVASGEWWRFITATLLHGNPGHLFNNVAGLLIFGNLLEPIIGSWRLGVLYIASVIAGLGLSYWMLPQGLTLGASTIDYGLIGAYLTLVLALRYRYNREAFFREFRSAVMFVILFVGWNTLEGATINVWAHIGGLVAGIGFALWLVFRPKKA